MGTHFVFFFLTFLSYVDNFTSSRVDVALGPNPKPKAQKTQIGQVRTEEGEEMAQSFIN